MSIVRRAFVEVSYEGKNITSDISPEMLSLTYNDNESGKSDDLAISIKDEDFLWSNEWFPNKGDIIEAAIVVLDEYGSERLNCGKFSIDQIDIGGPPNVLEINALSVPLNTNIRKKKQSRAWENVMLSSIASDVAKNGNLKLLYLAENDPLYDRRDQRNETDLQFLKRLCKDEALALKATNDQLVIFDPQEQEKSTPVAELYKIGGDVLTYKFQTQANDVYNSATVSYKDPKTGKLNKYTYTDKSIEQKQELKITKRAANAAEAERIAKSALREKNRNEWTASLTVIGNPNLVTGLTIAIKGYGKFDGKYLIAKSTHGVGSGYVTGLELTRVKA